MKILGIDYGKRKIGFAIAISELAEPFMVIKVDSDEEAISKILKVVEVEKVEKVVVGFSEGQIGLDSENFSRNLSHKLAEKKISVETFDETLSTQEAQRLSIEAGMKREKRKKLEDAFSAAIMLQSYLEEKKYV
jgi:putative Holliday junction resolvase